MYKSLITKIIKQIIKRQRIPKGQSKKDNPERLAAYGTQNEEKQNKKTTQYVLDTTMRKQRY
jgi:hypothetical protein